MGGKAGTARTSEQRAAHAAYMREQRKLKSSGLPGGRPRKHRYDEIFAEMGDIPEGDPLAVCEWAQLLAAKAMCETVQGRGNRERNQEIRAFARLIKALVPMERILEVERQITRAMKARREPTGSTGPEIVKVDQGSTAKRGRSPLRR